MNKDEKASFAVELIRDKYRILGRLPKKQDFDSKTLCFIKQVLGPWPRALEASGLKEVTSISSKEKNKLRHARVKAQRKREKAMQWEDLSG